MTIRRIVQFRDPDLLDLACELLINGFNCSEAEDDKWIDRTIANRWYTRKLCKEARKRRSAWAQLNAVSLEEIIDSVKADFWRALSRSPTLGLDPERYKRLPGLVWTAGIRNPLVDFAKVQTPIIHSLNSHTRGHIPPRAASGPSIESAIDLNLPCPADQLMTKEEMDHLRHFMETALTKTEQAILRWHLLERKTHKEIAKSLQISERRTKYEYDLALEAIRSLPGASSWFDL